MTSKPSFDNLRTSCNSSPYSYGEEGTRKELYQVWAISFVFYLFDMPIFT